MVRSKSKVATDIYSINKEYDYIRDILMDDYDYGVWRRCKAYYTYEKFKEYYNVLEGLSGGDKKEFKQRFIREMRRAIELGELDKSIYEDEDREKLDRLLLASNNGKTKLRRIKKLATRVIEKMRRK